MRDGIHRGAGVDARQALTQFFAFTCYVGFGQQDAVGVAHLRLGNGELVHLLVGMHRVNQRNHTVQQVAFANYFMGEKGLNNRAGIGHAGAFDHQTVEIDGAFVEVVEQIEQRVFQFARTGAADAAVGQGFDLCCAIANQLIVHRDFAEFVFDNGNLVTVLLVENMAQQGGFTRAKKTGE